MESIYNCKPYKECIICGTLNDNYREYCFCCNRSLQIKTVGVATSTEKLTIKVNKRQLIIDVSDIDQSSYEALVCFAEENEHLPIGKLVKEWLDYTAWDVAAWYVGDDL